MYKTNSLFNDLLTNKLVYLMINFQYYMLNIYVEKMIVKLVISRILGVINHHIQ